MTRDNFFIALSLAWLAACVVGSVYVIFFWWCRCGGVIAIGCSITQPVGSRCVARTDWFANHNEGR